MSMTARFSAIDRALPQVWLQFEALTLELIRSGRRRHSARDVLHRIRWDGSLRINDHWSPFYARKFLNAHPEHQGFFEFRASQADPLGRPRQLNLFDDDE